MATLSLVYVLLALISKNVLADQNKFTIEISREVFHKQSDENYCKYNILNFCVEDMSTHEIRSFVCESDHEPLRDFICGECKDFYKIEGCGCSKGFEWNNTTHECQPICSCDPIDNCLCSHGHCTARGICACNSGFMWDNSEEKCIPVCKLGCINGFCAGPDICKCFDGYESNSSYSCIPMCHDCLNGDCAEPLVCNCHEGFRKDSVNGQCIPVCNPTCVNGSCTAPNTCACHEGYTYITENSCSPVCDDHCLNGDCVSPQSCKCHIGFTKDSVNGQCIPVCSSGCVNGSCTAPNTCQCHEGYTTFTANSCSPVCTQCLNGDCVAPESCNCHNGFRKDSVNGPCIPVCNSGCVNGSCTAPNKCTCHEGYTHFSEESCSPVCDSCPNGVCVAPQSCTCDLGFVKDTVIGQCIPVCADGYIRSAENQCIRLMESQRINNGTSISLILALAGLLTLICCSIGLLAYWLYIDRTIVYRVQE